LKKSLSIRTTNSNQNVTDLKANQRQLQTASFGVFSIAEALLENGGYIHFNDQIFQKRGDKLVWIPKIKQFKSDLYLSDPIP
jgi:hypothetical protein